MKIRNGFVSNSSSSSFVIKYKGECDPLVTNIIEYIKENVNENRLYGIISDIDSLQKYFLNSIGYDSMDKVYDDSYYNQKYNDKLKFIEDGYTIVFGSIDYSEGFLYRVIYKMRGIDEN